MTQATSSRAYVRGPSDGDAVWFTGNLMTVKAGGEHTHGSVTVVEFVNPPGFAPPLHRHLYEDEMFSITAGTMRLQCDDERFDAGPGDFVLLPRGSVHSFLVGDEPLRCLQITTPSGFEKFAALAGEPARERRIPDPAPVDPAALGHAAALYGIEILGPPPF